MNPNIPHPEGASPLPEIETYEDARALSEKEQDYFFVAAFSLKRWLTNLLTEGQHSESEAWPRREVETLLIGLQPVVKCNDWTSGELLKVVRTLVSQPLSYPCWSEADLISYRERALVLPPLPPGPVPDQDLFPDGFDVAISLCPPLHGNPLSQPLWS